MTIKLNCQWNSLCLCWIQMVFDSKEPHLSSSSVILKSRTAGPSFFEKETYLCEYKCSWSDIKKTSNFHHGPSTWEIRNTQLAHLLLLCFWLSSCSKCVPCPQWSMTFTPAIQNILFDFFFFLPQQGKRGLRGIMRAMLHHQTFENTMIKDQIHLIYFTTPTFLLWILMPSLKHVDIVLFSRKLRCQSVLEHTSKDNFQSGATRMAMWHCDFVKEKKIMVNVQ